MPGLEETEQYLWGVVLLARNRKDGLQWLDVSADGFWRSFWAIAYSLPALAVNWANYRLAFLQAAEQPANAGLGFVLKLALIDVASWVLPVAVFAAAARPLGLERHFARFVVATNWLGVLTSYVLAVPALLRLLAIGAGALGALLSIAVFILSIVLLYRVTRASFDGDGLNAAIVTAAMIVLSIMLTGLLQNALGVALP